MTQYDLTPTRTGKMGRADRSQSNIGTAFMMGFALAFGFVLYLGLRNAPQALSPLDLAALLLILAVFALGSFAGYAMRVVGAGADALSVDDERVTAYLNGREIWSRTWADRAIRIDVTVQQKPWPGWEAEPPVIYLRDRILRMCNLTPSALEAVMETARKYHLSIESSPFRPPYYERVKIRHS